MTTEIDTICDHERNQCPLNSLSGNEAKFTLKIYKRLLQHFDAKHTPVVHNVI